MWMTESLKHLNLKQGRLLADGRGDATSSPDVSFSFSEIVLFRNSRQAGRQHLLVAWTGAKTTEFP